MSDKIDDGKPYVRDDINGFLYRSDDVEWWVHPSEDDGVGVLGPKPGAVPVGSRKGKHHRDFAPDAALPSYAGKVVTYPDDALKIEVDGLTFEVDAKIECHGESEGGFHAVSAVIFDAHDGRRKLDLRGYRGTAGSSALRDAVMDAVDRDWPSIFAWCVEKADEERE